MYSSCVMEISFEIFKLKLNLDYCFIIIKDSLSILWIVCMYLFTLEYLLF